MLRILLQRGATALLSKRSLHSSNALAPRPTIDDYVHSSNALAPRPTIDDYVTDIDKICGLFYQKLLYRRSALESAFLQAGIQPTPTTIQNLTEVKKIKIRHLLAFFRWAVKQPTTQADLLQCHHIMLSALAKRNELQEMENVIEQMTYEGPPPTSKTLRILITKYLEEGLTDKVVGVFHALKTYGLDGDISAFNSLIQVLCEYSHVATADSLVTNMGEGLCVDGSTYNILIGGWATTGDIDRVFGALYHMIEMGFEPDHVAYNNVIKGLCGIGRIEDAAMILQVMEGDKGIVPTSMNYNTLISAAAARDDMNGMMDYYSQMVAKGCRPDVVTYTVLIENLVFYRRVADVLELVDAMFENGIVPDVTTMKKFISPLSRFGPPNAALRIFKTMKRHGVEPDFMTYRMLLQRLARFGKWRRMWSLWKEMEDKGLNSDSVAVYDFMIDGMCNGKRWRLACSFMHEAFDKGICPNKIVCTKMVRSLEHALRFEEAIAVRDRLKETRNRLRMRAAWCKTGWKYS